MHGVLSDDPSMARAHWSRQMSWLQTVEVIAHQARAIEDTDHLLHIGSESGDDVLDDLLPDGVAVLYRRLVETGGRDLDEDDPVAERLMRSGVASKAGGRLQAMAPIDVLGRVLADEYRWITQRQQAVRSAFADLQVLRDQAGCPGHQGAGEDVVSVLLEAGVHHAATELHATALEELLDLVPSMRLADPWTASFVQVSGAAPGHRVLGPHGVQLPLDPKPKIRAVTSVPAFLRIADGRAALVAGRGEGALLIRSSWLATALRELFELAWERAVPADGHETPAALTPARWQVLQLMATGMDDAEVAAATGKSVRTVRAHIAAIMSTLGTRTRLATGAEVARRGWLP
ncbi:LuxR C-terminal-related transcriptional regulator [Streptomyces sp. KR80]|uniref:LuxR C-terminal-related transcriptional regulator n=1 Tax=Streptomyces sp. KR80 TaxID=3457426 RepID=UPI003FCEF182